MRGRWTLGLMAAFFVFDGPCVYAGKTGDRISVELVICDKVGLDEVTRLHARTETTRILRGAGIDSTWKDFKSQSTATVFRLDSFEDCEFPSLDRYILVVITPHEPKAWPPSLMGLAPKPTDGHRRAYILYNRVKDYAAEHRPASWQSDLGAILGNVIAHELGHLLIPGQAHSPEGLMRANWGRNEAIHAVSGGLVFGSDQVRRIQTGWASK